MREGRRNRFSISVAALLVLLMLLAAGVAYAKKPAPPPPPDPVDVGTIYYQNWSTELYRNALYSMNPDGTGKTLLPIGVAEPPAVPSSVLHDGKRWFLTLRRVEGETYPGGHYTRVNPWAIAVEFDQNGEYQVSAEVELLDDPTLRPNTDIEGNAGEARLHWAMDGDVVDGKISMVAERHLADGTMADYGLHVFHLDWTTMTVVEDPEVIDIGTLRRGTLYPNLRGVLNVSLDWSPDGEAIVFSNITDGKQINVSRAIDGWLAEPLTGTPGTVTDWSPDGMTICFSEGRDTGISLIDPDGSNERVILPGEPVGPACFSPSGTHLVHYVGLGPPDNLGLYRKGLDIHVTSIDGQTSVNLTKDIEGGPSPQAWGAE